MDATYPIHLARAAQTASLRTHSTTHHQRAEPASQASDGPTTAHNANRTRIVSRLVAGVVPGGVHFEGEGTPAHAREALTMYRHPADRNTAATGVALGALAAGKTLDVTA